MDLNDLNPVLKHDPGRVREEATTVLRELFPSHKESKKIVAKRLFDNLAGSTKECRREEAGKFLIPHLGAGKVCQNIGYVTSTDQQTVDQCIVDLRDAFCDPDKVLFSVGQQAEVARYVGGEHYKLEAYFQRVMHCIPPLCRDLSDLVQQGNSVIPANGLC